MSAGSSEIQLLHDIFRVAVAHTEGEVFIEFNHINFSSMKNEIMVISNPKEPEDGKTMSTGIIFNSSARNVLATLGLAAAMAFSPLKEAFGQKVGDTFSVPDAKEVIYKRQNQIPILAMRQLQLSTKSTAGNPIYVSTERLLTASPDGKSGYSLKGNGHELRSSTTYTVDDNFSGGVQAFGGITSVSQLPKLDISPVAQSKREKGAAQLFSEGYEYVLLMASNDGSYKEYFVKPDKDGGFVNGTKIQGDRVKLIHLSDQYVLLPGFENLKKSSGSVVASMKHPNAAMAVRIDN